MKKLSPFRIGCTRRRFVGFAGVNKLKYKGSTGNNSLTAWKKISSDYPKGIKNFRCWEFDSRNSIRFQDTRFARWLTADLLHFQLMMSHSTGYTHTTTNWGMSSSPPSQVLVFHTFSSTLYDTPRLLNVSCNLLTRFIRSLSIVMAW